ncbi:MAG TPA: hypothetical protein DCF68_23010 [Cyanothece sp. UBA12306]|nr:hypothetical protein [Cyanothece sp. UBA12306]
MIMLDISKVTRGTGPVTNNRVFAELKSITMRDILSKGQGNKNLKQDFFAVYSNWLNSCTIAPVKGLDQFPYLYFVNGVTQTYDIFFREYKGKRFRTAKGDYPYLKLSVDNWVYLEDDEIRENDAVALTYPFYENGGIPRNFNLLLDRCEELKVPVMIDAAYFGTCYDVDFDYSHRAIEMLGFSLSKCFAMSSFRIGIQFSKRKFNYLAELQTNSRYFNQVGAYVGLKLMQKFPADFIPSTYKTPHQEICKKMDLLPTNCIMLANIKPEDRRFDKLLEDKRFPQVTLPDGAYHRVGISKYISDKDSKVKKLLKQLLGK